MEGIVSAVLGKIGLGGIATLSAGILGLFFKQRGELKSIAAAYSETADIFRVLRKATGVNSPSGRMIAKEELDLILKEGEEALDAIGKVKFIKNWLKKKGVA